MVEDFRQAANTLRSVLDFAETSKPPASLRIVINNNTIVGLSAWLEESIRLISQEYLSVLQENVSDFRKLRPSIQQSNVESALHIIKNARKNNDHRTASDCSRNLSVCLDGSPGYALHAENITYNQGNFRSQQLTDSAKAIGVDKIWDRICRSEEVEQFVGGGSEERRKSALISRWNEIFDERDLIVHRVSQASGWGPDRIVQAIELSEFVVFRFSECLAEDCNEFIFHFNKINNNPETPLP